MRVNGYADAYNLAVAEDELRDSAATASLVCRHQPASVQRRCAADLVDTYVCVCAQTAPGILEALQKEVIRALPRGHTPAKSSRFTTDWNTTNPQDASAATEVAHGT
ncbi:hypothetical protein [Aquisalimonas sp.]|uniref:hypothetical protein n=1 Tax=Aquisalimonas sp. TaxID=1872621 RepID=UPI0025BA4C97|nr:hypothetical protein [Aquisalimonas sp.]